MGFITPFSFTLPTRIEFGCGRYEKIPLYLKETGATRVLLVTDPGVRRQAWMVDIEQGVREAGLVLETFDDVEPNPKDRNVEAAATAARALKADCLLAVGGGSPIDCAKAAAVVAVQGGRCRDYEDRSRIGPAPLPVLAAPTSAGTASEVTFGAVITDTSARFKFTVKSPRLAPRIAVLDPLLTLSKPAALTAATGMDALTHAIEAYTSRAAEPIADACALYAAELIARNLPIVVEDGGDREARGAMLIGSLLAGLAFSHSNVGAVHCIAEALGGMYDLAHGVCNAVCLPVVMRHNNPACFERHARLAQAFGLSSEGHPGAEKMAEAAVEFVADLARRVGLPSFRELGAKKADIPLIAEKSAANGSNPDNPRPMDTKDYMKVLEELFES